MIAIGKLPAEEEEVPPEVTLVLFSNNQVYSNRVPAGDRTVVLNASRLVVMGNYVAEPESGGLSICLPWIPAGGGDSHRQPHAQWRL